MRGIAPFPLGNISYIFFVSVSPPQAVTLSFKDDSIMRSTILLLLFCLTFLATFGQPFLATRAAMFNQGPDPYKGPNGVEHVEIWRYIPGARFESGWDVKIEDREYDTKGRLTSWSRYQTVSGFLIWRKEYTYNNNGSRKTEHTFQQREGIDVRWSYVTVGTDSLGGLGQKLEDENGKVVATLVTKASGEQTYIENPYDLSKRRIFSFDAEGRSVEMTDMMAGKQLIYTYDEKGEMLKMIQRTQRGESIADYKNTYNKEGQLTEQIELINKKKLARKFIYDAQGNLLLKKDANGNPVEYRYYFSGGNLSNVLILGPEGHPLEVIRYVYLNF